MINIQNKKLESKACIMKFYLLRFDIFGIVIAKNPLANSRTTGIRNVIVQCLSIKNATKIDPTLLPIRPNIIEMPIAIARILVGKSSTVAALIKVVLSPARIN